MKAIGIPCHLGQALTGWIIVLFQLISGENLPMYHRKYLKQHTIFRQLFFYKNDNDVNGNHRRILALTISK